MPGGLLNLVAYGNQNIILNGNPKKTFFKPVYSRYTNFGMQKFRLDFDGQKALRLSEESKYTFKVKRYAELLMDTYLVVTLPTIWSPIMPPADCNGKWAPYEFRWIENLGTQLIKEIEITVGGQTLQRISGSYLLAMAQRDFTATQKATYDNMTGNVPELNDPGNCNGRVNQYPNAYYTPEPQGPEPSIRSRKIYVPLNLWFGMNSKMAFPLVAMQYNELHINITLRSIQDLIQIRDVSDMENDYPLIRPNFNEPLQQFYRFLQPPPSIALNDTDYEDKRTNWNADINLLATYCFLSSDEARVFAALEQNYLFKSVFETTYLNVTGSRRIDLDNTAGMVSSWMFYFQRSDAYLRNEWSNYTNWPYNYLPYNLESAPEIGKHTIDTVCNDNANFNTGFGPGLNPPDNMSTGLYITGTYHEANHKNILMNMGIIMDGKYRENLMEEGVFNYVEKYLTSKGDAPDGLYMYNFCLDTDPFTIQPSGAMNISKFQTIQFEFTTYVPPIDENAQVLTICDPETGIVIGVNKPTWRLYDYNYNLTVLEERYNMVSFVGGNCGLMYAR